MHKFRYDFDAGVEHLYDAIAPYKPYECDLIQVPGMDRRLLPDCVILLQRVDRQVGGKIHLSRCPVVHGGVVISTLSPIPLARLRR